MGKYEGVRQPGINDIVGKGYMHMNDAQDISKVLLKAADRCVDSFDIHIKNECQNEAFICHCLGILTVLQ